MRGNNGFISAETYPESAIAEIPTVVCDVVNVSEAENVCSSSLAASSETCLLTESETEGIRPSGPQSMELVDRPSSQLSTRSEQNPWQTKKRKNKKRKKNSGNGSLDLDEPLYGFRILANLGTE